MKCPIPEIILRIQWIKVHTELSVGEKNKPALSHCLHFNSSVSKDLFAVKGSSSKISWDQFSWHCYNVDYLT